MKENEMVRKLVMYELKNTPIIKYVLTIVILGLIAFVVTPYLHVVTTGERLSVMADILVFLTLSVPIALIRYKPFTVQNVKGDLYASSFFILLKQAPISAKAIRKSQFIITALYTVCFNVPLFMIVYMLSADLQLTLSIGQAIILGIFWLSISYIWGGIYAAGVPGGTYSSLAMTIWLIIYIFIFIFTLTGLNIFLENAMLTWSFQIVQTSPLFLLFIACMIVIVSTTIWNMEYRRYEKKVNYHV